MIELLAEFFSFNDAYLNYTIFGLIFLSIAAALIGCFTYVRRESLISDAASHAMLPGIVIAFLFSQQKSIVFILPGAIISSSLALYAIDYLTYHTKLKKDGAIAVVLSLFFGIGIFLFSLADRVTPATSIAGLDSFLFGNAAAMLPEDFYIITLTALFILLVVILLKTNWIAISFDPLYCQSIGMPYKRLTFLLKLALILAIVVGIQAVGVILIAALIISPAAIAHFIKPRMSFMLITSSIIGAFAGIGGAFISFVSPKMPTGPWIVLIPIFIASFAFLLAVPNGYFYRLWTANKRQFQVVKDHVLKAFYAYHEKEFITNVSRVQLVKQTGDESWMIKLAIWSLKSQSFIEKSGTDCYQLTEKGKTLSKSIVRRHRLWETYLVQCLRIKHDHVHDDAEYMEHLIDDQIENKLIQLLNRPSHDPHGSLIPY
ncbi:MAG: metal ABC transporter permease [Cyclobacteriaceae bacterium]|nr:metal ABC transporter permease [Cyclobacteriaceae bacterium]MCH8517386.1 metal ABC transporter permease [Cyclobacteriaceae bacterium]